MTTEEQPFVIDNQDQKTKALMDERHYPRMDRWHLKANGCWVIQKKRHSIKVL